MVFGVARGLLGGKRLSMTRVKPRGGELEKISALIEAGKIRPMVERVFALEQIAEAHRLSEAGHVRGKLVIRIREEG
jgi:NADPH:quinone reductase-like Zn-dependent oxidoreductase